MWNNTYQDHHSQSHDGGSVSKNEEKYDMKQPLHLL